MIYQMSQRNGRQVNANIQRH